MYESKLRSHAVPKEKSEEAKRTTIILEKSEREFIESLIKDGKESGIKPLISKMLDIYRSMMIYDWRFPGEYYCGISRIALVNVELFNILTQQIPKERWHEIGEKMGDALKVSIQSSTLGIEASEQENWEKIFERLKVQGFGDFYLKDKFLLLKTPFINDCEIWKGIMEGLLSVELETRNSVPPLVFEVKKRKPPSI
jgi:predicted phosphoadenosine phosphosulfate sulfurtransferase